MLAAQGAFVVTFGIAGEDKKFSKLGDVEATLQGFAGADYDLQVLHHTLSIVLPATSCRCTVWNIMHMHCMCNTIHTNCLEQHSYVLCATTYMHTIYTLQCKAGIYS